MRKKTKEKMIYAITIILIVMFCMSILVSFL